MDERPIVLHQGVYKRTATTAEAIFMIIGMTIGAGILGLPYAVATVGVKIGLITIFVLGMIMMMLNLMIGEIAVRTNEPMQLPGFAGRYLGTWAKVLMSFMVIFAGFGILLAFIVGVGQALEVLLGIDSRLGSLIFWALGTVMVWRGLQTIKKVEKIFSILVVLIIAGLSLYLLPQHEAVNWQFTNWSNIFFPFGIVLFALNATSGIIEAHALLPGSQKRYRRAVIIGTLIPMFLYMLFVAAVIGVSGHSATSIATVGLGQKYGGWIFWVGNLFAVLALSNGFMGMGVALKQTLVWDQHLPKILAVTLAMGIPMILFVFGFNNFVAILDVVGGVFIGIESIIMVMTCYMARRQGDLSAARYGMHYFWILAIPVLTVFVLVTAASVFNLIK